ncbi:hypothetical protein KAR91_27005 [Candidatus Pacearchaeota archaeon]|nr:hypothetical protein [Candidatus Pacearchaeota archaeon]
MTEPATDIVIYKGVEIEFDPCLSDGSDDDLYIRDAREDDTADNVVFWP